MTPKCLCLHDTVLVVRPLLADTTAMVQTHPASDNLLCPTQRTCARSISVPIKYLLTPPQPRAVEYLSTSVPTEQSGFLMPEIKHYAIPRRPSSDILRRHIIDSRPACEGLQELRTSISTGTFWRLSQTDMLFAIKDAFTVELEYLETAYATTYPAGAATETLAPSKILYNGLGYPEIDRTLTGMLALYWIYHDDYNSFVNHQSAAVRLSRKSFSRLRAFYFSKTQNFNDTESVLALIILQMTNDLGKSRSLRNRYETGLSTNSASANHDTLLCQVLSYKPGLVPSVAFLGKEKRDTIYRLTKLSAEYSAPQLIQGECSPVTLETLTETKYGSSELNLKFMELFLDISGAAGHVNHEGAISMTEPVFRGLMKAHDVTQAVAAGELTPKRGYMEMMQSQVNYIVQCGPEDLGCWNLVQLEDTAIARILCMGRVADQQTASLYLEVFHNLPPLVKESLVQGLSTYSVKLTNGVLYGIQPTYFPSLLALIKDSDRCLWAARLTVLLEYLSHVVQAQRMEYTKLIKGGAANPMPVLERDVRELDIVLKSPEFKERPTIEALLSRGLPAVQIMKKVVRTSKA